MNQTQKIIKIGAIILAVIIIVNIFSLIISGLSWLINYDSNKDITFQENYYNIKEIEIDGLSSNIEIISGNQFKVEARNLKNKFTALEKNKKLSIEEEQKWFNKNNNGLIIITIPEDNVLKKISVDTGAGKLTIKDVLLKEIDIDHGAGILEITNVNFANADLDGGAGKIQINNSTLNNLELDTGVGEVDIEASITGKSQISCGIGALNLTLLGSKDNYQIKTEKGIGNIKINGENGDFDSFFLSWIKSF